MKATPYTVHRYRSEQEMLESVQNAADMWERMKLGHVADMLGKRYIGPGTYLTDTETILVFADSTSPFKRIQPNGTAYCVLVYGCHVSGTILAHTPPTRVDDRCV
jgi:hypothetical protein